MGFVVMPLSDDKRGDKQTRGVTVGDDEALRLRCAMLEDKVDRLVREAIRRERTARLLDDLVAELGQASGTHETIGRCLAHVVTALQLDLAFIVLAAPIRGDSEGVLSFGCPRLILDALRDVQWSTLEASPKMEWPYRLSELFGPSTASSLRRVMQLEGVPSIIVFELRTHGAAVGYLGLGDRRRDLGQEGDWAHLKPAAMQIANVIESARLAEASASAESFAKQVLQYLPSTVVITDPAGTVVQCYDAKQDLFRRRLHVGASLRAFLPAREARLILDPIADVGRGGDPSYLRALRLELGETARVVNVSVAPLSGNHVVTVFEDVTRSASVASDLRRARALTSTMFANAPAGVIYLRQNGEVVDVNSAAASLLKRARGDLLGERLPQCFPALWRAITASTNGSRAELSFPLEGEQQATVSFIVTHLARSGRPAGMLVQLQDLGELQAIRDKLRRQDNLALMGRMVSFVAHEIKNPLFGISSAAQVLVRERDSSEANRLAEAMLSEIERLGSLLEELLVFGRQGTIELVPCEPADLCREIATMQEPVATKRQLVLKLALAAPSLLVPADPARLRQVIVNLVANAIEASPPHGTVALATGIRAGHYVIGVSNGGEPIPRDKRERIFDLFYTTKPRGNGLGLSICKKIVDDHGGLLRVESSPEAGTCFEVHLPLAEEQGE